MSLLLFSHYKLAYDSVSRNRSRSFLTCLGIAIGIAAIILILSLMGSINRLVTGQISATGANLIVVRPDSKQGTSEKFISELALSSQYQKSNLSLADAEVIKNLNGIASVAPLSISNYTISAELISESGEPYTQTVPSAAVVGTSYDFLSMQNLELKSGTFLGLDANTARTGLIPNSRQNSATIGRSLAYELFGTTEVVGKTFTLDDERFLVTGVLAEVNDPINYNNVDVDNSLFVYADFLKSIDPGTQIQQINAIAENTDAVPLLAREITERLQAEKSGDQNFSVSYGSEISHPAGSLFQVVSAMLTVVAGVSLVVGGIGVMNIMLVSVSERTREIGIRKAVGATSLHIMLQFLFEALILTCLGGVFGILLGYGLAFLISVVTPFAPFVNIDIIMITLGTSVLLGLLFGLYPALRAARKNPIESLRYYR